MKHIAVQEGLTPVIELLRDSGYNVSEFNTRQRTSKDFLDGFDAVVLTGLDDNVMGIQITDNNRPFIEAKGMTPEDIKAVIDERVQ